MKTPIVTKFRKKPFFNVILVFVYVMVIACAGRPINEDDPKNDPSNIAIDGERFRVLGDFNCDGLEDMALSDEMSTFGTGGIGFTLYLKNDKNKLVESGKFGTKPGLMSVECYWENPRLWTYWHMSAQSGIIAACEVTDSGLSNWEGMEIYPGDGGTGIGNAIHTAVFQNSDIEFRVQRSITTDGKVEWVDE